MLVLHNRTFLFPQKIDTEDKSYSNAHMYTCLCWKDQHRPAQPYCSSTEIACWNTSTPGIVKTKKLNIFSSSHHLLTLISLQTCLTFYLLWNIKRYFDKCLFFPIHFCPYSGGQWSSKLGTNALQNIFCRRKSIIQVWTWVNDDRIFIWVLSL